MSDITLEEQERILTLAEGLIRDPESWAIGSWECPAYKRDKEGGIVENEDGPVPLLDANGNQRKSYCIEGAVNRATALVLGEERAAELGGLTFREGKYVNSGEGFESLGISPTRLMGLDDIAWELYSEQAGMDDTECRAMYFNDSADGGGSEEQAQVHAGVLNILRIGRERVKKARKSS